MNINESLESTSSKAKQLISETLLLTLVDVENPPATYARGSTCIDFILCTPNIYSSNVAMGYLPFYTGAWESDHPGMYVDINTNDWFDIKNNNCNKYIGRNLKSSKWIHATTFMARLGKNKTIKSLENELKTLQKYHTLATKQLQDLDRIDTVFTKTLIDSEKCNVVEDIHWSDVIHQARIVQKYWRITVKVITNRLDSTDVLNRLQQKLTHPRNNLAR
jgi:hypothetical protein